MGSIEQYKMMLTIATAGSVSQAAVKLHMTQPYLSSVLKTVESELGFKLFERSHSGVALTEEGRQFIQYATEIQGLIHKIENISIPKVPADQLLTIASFYSYTLLDQYYAFKGVEQPFVQYEEVQNSRIREKVESGSALMGILYLEAQSEKRLRSQFDKSQMQFHEIYREPVCAIVGKNHPLRSKATLTVKELKDFPMLIESYKTEEEIFGNEVKGIISLFKDFSVEPLHFDNNRSLFYFLIQSKKHFSIGLASHNINNPFVKSGDLFYIPIAHAKMEVLTGYLVHKDWKNNSLAISFSDRLHQFYREFQSKNSLTV